MKRRQKVYWSVFRRREGQITHWAAVALANVPFRARNWGLGIHIIRDAAPFRSWDGMAEVQHKFVPVDVNKHRCRPVLNTPIFWTETPVAPTP